MPQLLLFAVLDRAFMCQVDIPVTYWTHNFACLATQFNYLGGPVEVISRSVECFLSEALGATELISELYHLNKLVFLAFVFLL